MPGYFLSQATEERSTGADNRFPSGSTIPQLAGLFEPGELIGVPGLAVGGRYVDGHGGDGYFEPMLRYRRELLDGLSMGAVGYGTLAEGSAEGASYSAIRAGAEASVDYRLLPESRWVEIHLLGGGSLTGLSVEGRYCHDDEGFGRDCQLSTDGSFEPPTVSGHARGAYPTGFAGISLDFARHSGNIFHGARLAFLTAVGTMPALRYGEQQPARLWTSWGLSLSVGVGGRE